MNWLIHNVKSKLGDNSDWPRACLIVQLNIDRIYAQESRLGALKNIEYRMYWIRYRCKFRFIDILIY
jgi:hypothetical protein